MDQEMSTPEPLNAFPYGMYLGCVRQLLRLSVGGPDKGRPRAEMHILPSEVAEK